MQTIANKGGIGSTLQIRRPSVTEQSLTSHIARVHSVNHSCRTCKRRFSLQARLSDWPPARCGSPKSSGGRGGASLGCRLGFEDRQQNVCCRAASTEEMSQAMPSNGARPVRSATVRRQTKETTVDVSINLDGTGICTSSSQIPFLDHMMDQLASHGLFNVVVQAEGDIHIDDHHTNEDIALALGTALAQALGDRKGIYRFGDFTAPLDEALVHVVLDLSGRPHLSCDLEFGSERIGTYDVQLVEHFFQSLANTSGMTLHIRQLAGRNSHHIVEATFKAFARALRQATEPDPRREGQIASSKGVLTRN
eukprot:jgi/Botrbrau1/9515/Bobra.0211s0006.1